MPIKMMVMTRQNSSPVVLCINDNQMIHILNIVVVLILPVCAYLTMPKALIDIALF